MSCKKILISLILTFCFFYNSFPQNISLKKEILFEGNIVFTSEELKEILSLDIIEYKNINSAYISKKYRTFI